MDDAADIPSFNHVSAKGWKTRGSAGARMKRIIGYQEFKVYHVSPGVICVWRRFCLLS